MELWIKILAGVIPGAVIVASIFIFLWCRRCRKQQQQQKQQFFISNSLPKPSKDTSFQAAIAKLHLSHKSSSETSLRFHQLHHHPHHQDAHQKNHGGQALPFSWDSHPRLISEAAENGWSRFVFANRALVPRSSSPLWGLCSVCDGGRPPEVGEISWEVPAGSSEFMQTVRINPAGAKRSGSANSTNSPLRVADESIASCIRMSLPLPGPPLIGTSFPQEAYFEITILYLQPMTRASRGSSKQSKDGPVGDSEDDRVKLIEENSNSVQSDALVHGLGDSGDMSQVKKKINSPFQDPKSALGDDKHKNSLISLGLTRGGSPPTKPMTGTYPGSIGFHSNGCVYLDGLKLVSESEKTDWAGVNRVIGCGFNPSKKKVYFTVDSELIHVIRCNSDAFKNPLYPVLSSNSDVMVLVNLGQAAFKYAPANAHRTANPCFIRSSPSCNGGSVIGYEDSRELFSMGRIDSDWLDDDRSKSAGNTHGKNSCRSSRKSSDNWEDASVAVDIDGESDLFEISLNN